jgi:SAM-dependent methyltransferase
MYTRRAMEAERKDLLDVRNPEIRVDEIMQRIQEKVRSARAERIASSGAPPVASFDVSGWQPVDEVLARAQDVAQVGAALPPMTRMHGLKRLVAANVARAFLRMAQVITRDQRSFNLAVLDLLRTIYDRLRGQAGQIAALQNDVGTLRAQLDAARADLTRAGTELRQLRTSMSLQERRLASFLEAPKDGARAQPEARPTIASEATHVWDAVYLHFEDEFRGSREDIKKRVAVYVPKLRAAGAGSEAAPILDLGCGRGELIEVLQADGLVASGVDTNGAAVEQCRERGLKVELRDAFEALRDVPDGSLGGLTALHVVEHLPFELVLKLLDETLRVLRPGGMAIFETPNPKNVLVGSANFYIDPTHRNPVHPLTLRYLMEARGMLRVETLMLHPAGPEEQIPDPDSEVARRFNEYFYGPQDYAVLGRRA